MTEKGKPPDVTLIEHPDGVEAALSSAKAREVFRHWGSLALRLATTQDELDEFLAECRERGLVVADLRDTASKKAWRSVGKR